MQYVIKNIIILILVGFSNIALGQNLDLYESRFYTNDMDTLNYRILMPKDFDESKEYPVILFLHGAGERGDDNKSQLVHGSKLFLDPLNRGAFPAIVIFPQCPKDDYWSNQVVDKSTTPVTLIYPKNDPPKKALKLVMLLMEDFLVKPFVDKEKVYVGGLSMGGKGTFEILYRKPDMFAAAFAICGAGNTEQAEKYAQKVPTWIFHGAKDDITNPRYSIEMVDAILKYGGNPNFTLYGDDNHNSWDSAFAEPELLTWLFSNSK